ncbi:50S ribosomal protein L7/L12 [Neochlamydia sp. EPS4]|uniref:50S ribosomal protein L7/L12 n=1 Tax=unclassified Neochlamydia TaxID=2643326 RepID=UPI00057DAECE|nr:MULTISPECIES: 50S ribosomal protein L7/L12 [unclassified Neochlamydia]MBS4166624.1 50S ribosomal protein L7/L12 [Neochlamydia sp. AcF65]MBS4171347.1 50S ribosomal protein L7/L12 [Neochlamydia sp. AcF95]NGY94781.1 50S ribosomal protein L7/L12 [Neochlamydia sp. AcF84]KIC74733.1 50S ribosomal protein L7/L12 [Neochlamydia sp. EPS4]KIC74977.1 50S ribosomal protein L7/L12 [Neochlamydia sp. TUME1]
MSKKTEDLVNTLSELSVLEMSELKTMLEDKWGVKAAAAAVAVAAPAAAAPAAPEATDFQVTLVESPADKKIGVIKVVREITGLGLKEAKELVDGAPKVVKETAPKAEAEDIKKKLETAGAKVTLKGL